MITSLKLANFKCFDELEIPIAPLTLITGINSMGKSTVIQSLLLLRQSFDERFLQLENKVILSGPLVNLISGEAIRYVLAKEPLTSIDIEFGKGLNGVWSIVSQGTEDLLKCNYSGGEPSVIYSQNIFDDNFVYIAAERMGPRVKYSTEVVFKKHKGRLGVGFAGLAPSYLYNCLSSFAKLPITNLKHPNAGNDFIYDNTSAWLGEIFYEGAAVTANEKENSAVELKYSFKKGKFPEQGFSPLNVGFGFSYVLPVILSILSAPPGSLILMENPEAHLHPAAQSKIGKLIALAAQNDVQFIVETHSDHLLNGIRVAVNKGILQPKNTQIHYFTSDTIDGNEKDYPISFKIREKGEIERWPKGFFDQWDNSLDELLS